MKSRKGGFEERLSWPRPVDQATQQVAAEQQTLDGGPDLDETTDQIPLAPYESQPRSAGQSTREVLLDGEPLRTRANPQPSSGPEPSSRRQAATSRHGSAPLPSAPAHWPPDVADYCGGEGGPTVQEVRGITASDLASFSSQASRPAGVGADFPDPWSTTAEPMSPRSSDSGFPRHERPVGVQGSEYAEARVVEQRDIVTGSIELPAPPTQSSPTPPPTDGSTTDHVGRQAAASSPRIILTAALAATVVLGTALVLGLWLTGAARRDSAAQLGSLLIRTIPPAGCAVFVNGGPTGLLAPGSSLLLSDLPQADYEVSIRCVGFADFERTMPVRAGEVTLLKAQLPAAAPRSEGIR